jgi:hypothetical protein
MYVSKSRAKDFFPYLISAALTIGISGQSMAFSIDAGSDWQIRWDNSLLYNLGFRAQSIDDGIGNNPSFSESDYKFDDRGDIVTNRISNLSEFDAVYQNKYGVRVSASMWRDFAYDDDVENHPGLPQALWGSYSKGRYSNHTSRYYRQGGEFLDAFVFANFQLAGRNASLRVGRLTQFWGNTQFYGGLGINYGQNPSDGIKGLTSPGSKAKELTIPRAQILLQTGLTDTLSMTAQVFGEFRPNRLPEGGTFLGTVGFGLRGADRVAVAPGVFVPRGNDIEPSAGDDWGLKLTWAPEWMDAGNIGFYYRKLSETQPWLFFTPTFSDYHLTYANDVTMYAISVDTDIGDATAGTRVSAGFELSYREDAALNSVGASTPLDGGTDGPRGDTLQLLANAFYGLPPTSLWDTGNLIAEVAYQRLVSTNSRNKAMALNEHTLACPGGAEDGCNTKNSWGFSVFFAPQWLSVAPGVNLDMPVFLQYQVKGNTATRAGGNKEGNAVYSVGLHANIRSRYDVTLAYNGYRGKNNGRNTLGPVGVYNADDYGGNGLNFFNDRGWVSLTLGTTF